MGKIKRLIKNLLLYFIKPKWQKIEYFDEAWKKRIGLMASFIDTGDKAVCDIGCGKEWLKPMLPLGVRYYPVDYTKRSDDTIVCDLNKKEMPPPETISDVIFCSGVMEYVQDWTWFIREITKHSKKIIISYCTIEDLPSTRDRNNLAWKNHLHSTDLISSFANEKFKLRESTNLNKNSIFVFEKENSV